MSGVKPDHLKLTPYPGPGPEERKWTSRLRFRVFGHWPRAVVDERLRISDQHFARLLADAECQHLGGGNA